MLNDDAWSQRRGPSDERSRAREVSATFGLEADAIAEKDHHSQGEVPLNSEAPAMQNGQRPAQRCSSQRQCRPRADADPNLGPSVLGQSLDGPFSAVSKQIFASK